MRCSIYSAILGGVLGVACGPSYTEADMPPPLPTEEPAAEQPEPTGPPRWSPPSLSPPDVPRPAHLGSPGESRQAAPVWTDRQLYAPQIRDLGEVLGRSHAEVARDVLLVCLLTPRHLGSDRFSRAEPRGGLRLGQDGPLVKSTAMGGLTVTAPAITLDSGDTVRAFAWEEDLLLNDRLGGATGSYGGTLPLAFGNDRFGAICRGVARDVVEEGLTKALERLDATLVALTEGRGAPVLESASFRVRPADTGLPHEHPALKVRERFEDAAAWVGWDDPRIAERLQQLAAVEEAFDRGLGAQVERAEQSLSQSERWTLPGAGVALTDPALVCADSPKTGCWLEITAVNTSPAPWRMPDARDPSLHALEVLRLVDRQGRRAGLRAAQVELEGKLERIDAQVLMPGGKMRVVFALEPFVGVPLPKPPMLLAAKLTRLRWPATKPLSLGEGAVTATLTTVSCGDGEECDVIVRVQNDSEIKLQNWNNAFKKGPLRELYLAHGATQRRLLWPQREAFWKQDIDAGTSRDLKLRCRSITGVSTEAAELVVTLKPVDVYFRIPSRGGGG